MTKRPKLSKERAKHFTEQGEGLQVTLPGEKKPVSLEEAAKRSDKRKKASEA